MKIELFQLDQKFTEKDLYDYILKLQYQIEKEDILTLENSNLKLELTEIKLKLETIQKTELIVSKNKELFDFAKEHTVRKDQYKYQLYSPRDLSLIKTYNTIEECVSEKKLFKDAIRQSVYKAARENTLYKNYRFWRITQTDEDKQYKLEKTKEIDRSPKYEQIVQVDQLNTIVLNVFSCVEEAAKQNLKENGTDEDLRKLRKSITNNLSEDGSSYGYRWYRFSETPDNLLDNYNEPIPDVQINKNQKRITKTDADGNVVKIYNSVSSCFKEERVSEPTLRKSIVNKTILNAHYFTE